MQKYADVADGEWNDELNKLAYKAGRRVARDVFTEEEAEALVFEIPTAAVYYAENKSSFKNTWDSGFKSGVNNPWEPEEVEEYLEQQMLEQADFGKAPLPEGVTPTLPVPPMTAGALIPPPLPARVKKRRMSEIESEPTNWVWKGWLPRSMFVIYAGPGGRWEVHCDLLLGVHY